ncbi:MAG: EamA family transporter [Patescibacteria group bacterium]
MSNWFLFALVPPILWSIVNHIDKYMLSRYLKNRGVGALLVFSAFASIVLLPFILYFFHSQIFDVPFLGIVTLVLVGFLAMLASYFYLKGLESEETSVVIPLFQLVPVFGYFLGFVILGESLSTNQIFYSLIVITGIISLSLEISEENKIKLKKKVLILIASSSFFYALHDILFKKVAIVENFWVSVFWQYVSMLLFGILALVFIKKFRHDFFEMFHDMGHKLLFVNLISEILYLVGNLANNFAILLAPVALVLVVSSYQPLFVFIVGILLTIFLPKIAMERISKKHLLHKLISILIIIIGSYFLYTSSF